MKTTNQSFLNKYFLAGIDFMIDKNYNVYFIEANSVPGLFRFVQKTYKRCQTMIDVTNKFNKEQKFIFLYTPKSYSKDPDFKYKYRNIRKKFGKNKYALHLLPNITDDTAKEWCTTFLKSNNQETIYTPFIKIKKCFGKIIIIT